MGGINDLAPPREIPLALSPTGGVDEPPALWDETGLVLPEPPSPAGNYQAVVRAGDLLFVSGQFPVRDGRLVYAGRVGAELSLEQGYRAAELAALNVLAQIRRALGGLAALREIVRVEGHVASAPGFFHQPRVLDGASDLFARVLGIRAGHARTAFAPPALPMNAAVELAVIAAVDPAAA
jgi:enamine deaminase RidA (YjgF/YER057c/UK114 family)